MVCSLLVCHTGTAAIFCTCIVYTLYLALVRRSHVGTVLLHVWLRGFTMASAQVVCRCMHQHTRLAASCRPAARVPKGDLPCSAAAGCHWCCQKMIWGGIEVSHLIDTQLPHCRSTCLQYCWTSMRLEDWRTTIQGVLVVKIKLKSWYARTTRPKHDPPGPVARLVTCYCTVRCLVLLSSSS